MSKAVLMSIQPKWVEQIVSGKKTIEVRKTKPKLGTPFKGYIYEAYDKKYANTGFYWFETRHTFVHGCKKVIGEFVCDYITPFRPKSLLCDSEIVKKTCVNLGELIKYAPDKPFPKDHIYGWHISQLKIYDNPKELSEFKRWNRTEDNAPCAHTKWLYPDCKDCTECNLTRPPQSWVYVED